MKTANALAAMTLLDSFLARAAGVNALLLKAQDEDRDITDAELDQLAADDDSAKVRLDTAIAEARAREASGG